METNKIKNNKLFYGDNLTDLRKYIKDESVDLCYIDPPFNSKRNYNQIYLNQGSEDKAQAQAFVDTWEYDDAAADGYKEIIENEKNRFTTQTQLLIEGLAKVLGKGSLLAYMIHITLRTVEIHRVLKPTGTFFLHCDPTASHYLKLVCDSIFCPKGGDIRNEIIWSYKRYTAVSNRFQRLHDIIFFYSKSDEATFNDLREDYGDKSGTRDSHYKQDEDGNWYRMQKRKGKEPYIIYLSEGKRIGDVWEMPIINASAKERLGYPTQKPEALLERIILTSSNKDDVILDAYCGCGTTVAVAEKLHRKWIGIDITYQSISLILKRLEDNIGKSCLNDIEINGVPEDWESAVALAHKDEDRVRKEFEKWAILFYSNNRARINEKKGGDGGIDGIALIQDRNDNTDIENKKILFSVKSDKILVPAYVNQLKGKMHDTDVVMGVLICLYEPTKGMYKEAKEMGTYKNSLFNLEYPKLQIVTVKEMFDNDEKLTLPVIEVLKKAEFKGKVNSDQSKIDFE